VPFSKDRKRRITVKINKAVVLCMALSIALCGYIIYWQTITNDICLRIALAVIWLLEASQAVIYIDEFIGEIRTYKHKALGTPNKPTDAPVSKYK